MRGKPRKPKCTVMFFSTFYTGVYLLFKSLLYIYFVKAFYLYVGETLLHLSEHGCSSYFLLASCSIVHFMALQCVQFQLRFYYFICKEKNSFNFLLPTFCLLVPLISLLYINWTSIYVIIFILNKVQEKLKVERDYSFILWFSVLSIVAYIPMVCFLVLETFPLFSCRSSVLHPLRYCFSECVLHSTSVLKGIFLWVEEGFVLMPLACVVCDEKCFLCSFVPLNLHWFSFMYLLWWLYLCLSLQ